MAEYAITPEWLQELLRASSVEQQTEFLRAANLLSPEGLSLLLDTAERLAGADLNQTEQLTLLCEQLAARVQAPAAAPRARYLRAKVYGAKGEFETELALIEAARLEYTRLGLTLEAVRTNVGLMAVLGQTGHYQKALNIGQRALAQMGVKGEDVLENELPEQSLIAAMIYQNCGMCYGQIGRYAEALSAFAAARLRYQTLGMRQQLGQAVENTGLVRLALGQVQAALTAFENALRIYTEGALTLYQAETLVNIGEAHLLLSNFVQSLHAFEAAARLFAALGESVDQHILLRQLADAYLALNLYGEALDAYRKAQQGLAETGLTYDYAQILWGMGIALAAQAKIPEAQQMLAEAAERFQRIENTPLLSAVMLEQTSLLERVGAHDAARTLARQALDRVEAGNWTIQKIYAYLRNADLALPDAATALHWLLAAEQLVSPLELPQLRYRLQQRLGHVHLLQGDVQQAQTYLESAIEEIERLRDTLVQERMRASFLTDKLAAYEDLVQLHLQRGGAFSQQHAFQVAERAKSRALVDLLSGVIQARTEQAPDHAATRQLHSLQAELNALYNEILAGNTAGSNAGAGRTVDLALLQARAVELEQAISGLRLRLATAQSDAKPNVEQPIEPAAIWQALANDLYLVAYHIVGTEIIAFVCGAGQVHVIRHLATTPTIEQLLHRLAAQWARFRVGQPVMERHLGQLHQSTQRILHLLYTALLTPVVRLLDTFAPAGQHSLRKLVIVPHGLLHQVPFHALYDGVHYLLERFVVSYAPSATVFALCQQRALRKGDVALVIGVPDANVPHVATEVQQVARCLHQRSFNVHLLLNEQATLPNLTPLTNECSLLHIASHGLFRGDNPMFSALKLHGGWLTASEVTQLDLTGALVTLSACESGRSQIMGGDEIIGLTYAFLSAGAASLVVSQWLVQDSVTATLMEQWYKHCLGDAALSHTALRHLDLAEALRATQLEMMAQHPHPYYWAPFLLVGRRSIA
ncbi:MAG: CHAT domain-containing protein [Caldilineaceae bacterium]